jgi:4a-hydroxytetrahydrobiopterin dehydratase
MNLAKKQCISCAKNPPALDRNQAQKYLSSLKNWQISDNSNLSAKWLFKEFFFTNFLESLSFVNKVAAISEEQNHHPNIDFTWGKAKISLQTHKINGLCENDFILAAKIDEIS